MPSVTLEQATEIKARHEADLLKRKGVTGVTVAKTDEGAVLRVFVQDAASAADIPAEVDGVPVDVVRRTFDLH
ncbi:MAG: hypothetical protein WDO17_16160 [Alphaproteobacteria bacterium]